MIFKTCLTLLLLLSFNTWSQTQLAGWTFDALTATPSTPTTVVANLGAQANTATLYANGTNGSSNWTPATELNSLAGSTTGDPRTTTNAGQAYSLLGGTSNAANGKTIVLKISTTGFENPILTFATQRTAAGFATQQWAWSTNGSTFTNISTNTAATVTGSYQLKTIDLSAVAVDNQATLYLRLTVTGATNATGNNRLDNFVVTATPLAAASVPTVVTSSATPTANSASLSGNVTSTGGSAITSSGAVYALTGSNSNPQIGGPSVVQLVTSPQSGTTGPFTVNTGSALSVNTQYSANAYATNTTGTAYGTGITFYTLANTVAAPTVTDVTSSTANVSFTTNGNPAYTQFAIMANSSYVQANGTPSATPFFQTAAAWGSTIALSGLTPEVAYAITIVPRNGDLLESDASPATNITTLPFVASNVSPTQLNAFGAVCINTTQTGSFSFDGENLNGSNIILSGNAAYTFSTSSAGPFSNPLQISYTGGTISGQQVFVHFTPTAVANYDGSITFSGGGLSEGFQTFASGSGINTPAAITNGSAASVSQSAESISATIITGCSAVSAYGVEYSLTNGFTNGTGTIVNASALSAGQFTTSLTGLTPNTTYYYKTFVTDGTGTIRGAQQSFTTANLSAPTALAATNVTETGFTASWTAVPGATGYLLNVMSALNSASEDFTDGNFTASPTWSGNTANYAVLSSSTFPSGAGTTDGSFLASNASVGATAVVMPSTETHEWNFTLGSAAFSPAGTNYFGVILMSSTIVNNISGNFNGYFLRLGADGSEDRLQLYKRTATTSTLVGEFSATSAFPNGFQTGATIRVTRSDAGVFQLFISTGSFENAASTLTSAGTLTDNTHSASQYFGVFTNFANVNAARRVYIDNIRLGAPVFVAGYQNLAVSGTSQAVTGLSPETTYYYSVSATSPTSTSTESNVIAVTTSAPAATLSFGVLSVQPGALCDGATATFFVTGLLPSTSQTLTYNIGGGLDQTVTVISDTEGNASFTQVVTLANDDQLLTVTAVATTADPGTVYTVTETNEVLLKVFANVTYYADADGDGFGNSASSTASCTGIPAGYVTDNTDCNDALVTYADNDNDGFGSDTLAACGVANTDDCNDNQLTYVDADGDGFGGATLAACGVTNNSDCDDSILMYVDADGDGFGSDTLAACGVVNSEDCNDNQLTYADADGDGFGGTTQVACGLTNNSDCDDSVLMYVDADGDGFGSETLAACGVINNDDCNDNQLTYADADGDGFGGTTQVACGLTNNSDCDDSVLMYVDADADGFGSDTLAACGVVNSEDCDDNQLTYADADGDGFGGATLAACGVTNNNDCDDSVLMYVDADGDGFGSDTFAPCGVTNSDDCDDTQIQYADADGDGFGSIIPVACGVTNSSDCDDSALMYVDADGDTYGSSELTACDGATNSLDCNDSSAAINPSATEIIGNGIDENCNGMADDAAPMITTQLKAQYCGVALPNLYTALVATPLANVTHYYFEITDLSNNSVQTIDGTANYFQLTDLDDYQYATTYSVRVGLDVNGVWQGYGPACSVTTPSLNIVIPQCGTTLPQRNSPIFVTGPSFINSVEIRITNLSTGQSGVITRTVSWFTLKMFPALYAYSTTYSVEVRVATTGGYSNWTPACNVTTPAAPAGKSGNTTALFKAVASPNPYNDTFALNLNTTSDSNVQVKVFNMIGKLLETRNVKANDIEAQRLGNGYPSGVYNVVITQGETTESIRVIKR